ncbi:MAG: HAD-IA family hydrolase [Eggerthellaceae bacterium]|nr:HAD-IA family hydrolase [Eggerthellaceae bacterium]MDR2721311.1 HAD-IA family hydrolase [Coriobacteriaceae bacterium]
MTKPFVKAVFFDVGMTLIEPCPDIDGMFFEVARARGHHLSLEEVSSHLDTVYGFYEKAYRANGDFWCEGASAAEMYLDMYRLMSRLVGLEEDAETLAQQVHQEYLQAHAWKVFDDVKPCLEMLADRGIRLGVISNWASNLPHLLEGLALRSYFEEVVPSAAVGHRKPHKAIFELALERMGLDSVHAAHVGDVLDSDGIGARDAGLLPIIIDRQERHGNSGFNCVSSLLELPNFINSL